jgi:hypothetical protein
MSSQGRPKDEYRSAQHEGSISHRVIKTLAWTLLVGLVLSIALVAAVVSAIGPLDQTVIQLDGAPITLAQFHAGHWLVAVGAVMLALIVTLLIVLLVVPVAVLVPLTVAALVLVGALILVAGIAALAFSPLLICVGLAWLIWRLARGSSSDRKQPTPQRGATITG